MSLLKIDNLTVASPRWIFEKEYLAFEKYNFYQY
jgi:hypothetical protein